MSSPHHSNRSYPPAAGGISSSDGFSRSPPAGLLTFTNDHPLDEVNAVELSQRSSPSAPRVTAQPPPPQLPPPPLSAAPLTAPAAFRGPSPSFSSASTTTSSSAATLDDLADAFLSGPSPRTVERGLPPILIPDPLPADVTDLDRLKLLVQRRAWTDALRCSKQLMTGSTSHYAPLYESLMGHAQRRNNSNNNSTSHQLQTVAELALETHQQDLIDILTMHVTALVKLQHFRELSQAVEHWTFCHHRCGGGGGGDNKTNLDSASTTSTPPSWIPWSFHILAASTLHYGKGQQDTDTSTSNINSNNDDGDNTNSKAALTCLDALWAIRSDIPPDQATSILQVENALHNVFLSQKDWRMALDCLQRMIDCASAAAVEEVNSRNQQRPQPRKKIMNNNTSDNATVAHAFAAAYRSEFLSRQGRILLQAGALDQAEVIFQQAVVAWKEQNDSVMSTLRMDDVSHRDGPIGLVPAQLAVNDGLLKFSYGRYDEALECFRRAVQHLRTLPPQPPPVDYRYKHQNGPNAHPVLELSSRSSLYRETINNMALCALYTCHLPQALQLLESLVREDVTAHLTDRIALNLCTLYELASDSAVSARKKRVLQLIASRFLLHDIGTESFRVS